MAGAFYTYDSLSPSKTKFPDYYDGALFIFDWMRNWVRALRVDANDNYQRTEPFMASNGNFRRPIDLAFGKDGVMYMLEYGSVYGADNVDARLVKIEYNAGNRTPVAKASFGDSSTTSQAVSPTNGMLRELAGQAPLRVSFSSRGTSDPDEDEGLNYAWVFDGKTIGSTQPNPTHTYTQPGVYQAVLRVTDRAGAEGTDTLVIRVGNTPPEVTISTSGNQSFFWGNTPLAYSVRVTDKEDGKIDPKRVKVYSDYHPQGQLLEGSSTSSSRNSSRNSSKNLSIGYAIESTVETNRLGKGLVAKSDCQACHTVDKVSVGPSFLAIAYRYQQQAKAIDQLAEKIIAGGGGSWGTDHLMSAHPQLPVEDVREMVKYILSLAEPKKPRALLPLKGTFALKEHTDKATAEQPTGPPAGQYTLLAAYTDKGGKGVGPLTRTAAIILRPAKVLVFYADAHPGFPRWRNTVGQGRHRAFILLKHIDLTNIRTFSYNYASREEDGEIEVRLDSLTGPVISRTSYPATGDWKTLQRVTGELPQPVRGYHDVFFVALKPDKPDKDIIQLESIEFGK